MMLDKSPDGSAVPALMFVRMGVDHTTAASSGAHTPRSDVADNDYAIGRTRPGRQPFADLEAHGDFRHRRRCAERHRSCRCPSHDGFVISPYIPRGSVDHRFYNTVSYLRTIELLLGLPPMTQYDATSDCLLSWSEGEVVNREAFDAIIPSKEIIAERNPEKEWLRQDDPWRDLVAKSDAMDFIHPDSVPSEELNAIVWHTVKGIDATPPVAKASPLAKIIGGGDGDDDD